MKDGMCHGYGREIQGLDQYYIGHSENDLWHGHGEYRSGRMNIHQIGQFEKGIYIGP